MSSEYHYQRAKLVAHDHHEAAKEIMLEENPFKAMQITQKALPEVEVSEEWKTNEAKIAMSYANAIKFQSCEHAMKVLLNSHPLIAEATGDRFWGTGMHLEATKECLSEFWPGSNEMSNILMQLQAMFREEDKLSDRAKKHKAESPLANASKKTDTESEDGTSIHADSGHTEC